MGIKLSKTGLSILAAILFLMMAYSTPAMAVARGTYLYSLSSFTGMIQYDWVGTFFDRERKEMYITNGGDRSIRIFNENGMELYDFGEDQALDGMVGSVVDEEGNIFVLTLQHGGPKAPYEIVRCNYRGEPISTVEVKNLPPEFSDFIAHRMIYRNKSLYLADMASKKIIVTEPDGRFKKGYDLGRLLELSKQQKMDSGLSGFYVGLDGSMYFTISVFFTAYKLLPDGQLLSFGRKGSAPGRFNVVAGIASDEKGYVYVADRLRAVVMIFDKDFKFQSEFGYRGYGPENLVAPDQIELDGKGRLYVTQMARRGVSVFKVDY